MRYRLHEWLLKVILITQNTKLNGTWSFNITWFLWQSFRKYPSYRLQCAMRMNWITHVSKWL